MSSKKVEVKVREASAFGKATAWMRTRQIFTKKELVEFLKGLGKSDAAALATAVVLLSPRLESKRGDCRGNPSCGYGHQAYMEKLTRRIVDGKKEKQRFRFRLRATPLEPLMKVNKAKVENEKVAPAVSDTPANVSEGVEA